MVQDGVERWMSNSKHFLLLQRTHIQFPKPHTCFEVSVTWRNSGAFSDFYWHQTHMLYIYGHEGKTLLKNTYIKIEINKIFGERDQEVVLSI